MKKIKEEGTEKQLNKKLNCDDNTDPQNQNKVQDKNKNRNCYDNSITGNKKTAICGVFIALAMILSYLESLVPIMAITPGIKLGLANLVTIIVILRFGFKEAIFVSVGRILLSGILFGNVSVIIYSLAGAFLSILVMGLLCRIKNLSVTTISIAGGIMHNLGQIIVAAITIENTAVFYYMYILGIAGLVAGAIIGILAGLVMKRIRF